MKEIVENKVVEQPPPSDDHDSLNSRIDSKLDFSERFDDKE